MLYYYDYKYKTFNLIKSTVCQSFMSIMIILTIYLVFFSTDFLSIHGLLNVFLCVSKSEIFFLPVSKLEIKMTFLRNALNNYSL